MAITLVSHTAVAGLNTSTTPAIDTTGATLLVANLSGFAATLSDSKGNTWTRLTPHGTNGFSVLYYAAHPTVGTGHTFTFTGSSVSVAMQVEAFAGVDLSSPFSEQSGGQGGTGATGGAPGSLNATVPGELFVTGYQKENGTAETYTVDSSFVITNQSPYTASITFGGAMAYKVSSSPENPFWNGPLTSGRNGNTMATFLPTPSTLILPGTVQAAEAVAGVGPSTVAVMPMNVTAGNLLVIMTGHPGGNDCVPGGVTWSDTRGLTFTHQVAAENVSGAQSNSCIVTAPITSSGPETITRTSSSGPYPVAMLVMEFAIDSPSVVSTSAGTADGGTSVDSGSVSSALPNLLLVAVASDNGANVFDSASNPSGSVTQFTSAQGGFLFKFLTPGTYSATFNKSAGGGRFSAAAALIAFTPVVVVTPTTVSATCSIVIPPAFGTPTGIWLDLWVWRQLWHLDALTDTVSFLPVYRRALVMGLARELCREYGRDPAVVEQQADQAMAELEQSNVEIRSEGVKDLEQS